MAAAARAEAVRMRARVVAAMGRWGIHRKSLRHVPTVVDQSVGRSCTSESRSKHVRHFPHRGDGNLQVSAARTDCS